jgi:hypothetical protein
MVKGEDSYTYAGYSGFQRTTIENWTGGVL